MREEKSGVFRVPRERLDDRFACATHGVPVVNSVCLGCRVASWWRARAARGGS